MRLEDLGFENVTLHASANRGPSLVRSEAMMLLTSCFAGLNAECNGSGLTSLRFAKHLQAVMTAESLSCGASYIASRTVGVHCTAGWTALFVFGNKRLTGQLPRRLAVQFAR